MPLAWLLLSAATSGCSIYYFDPETGADNVWGFGHLAMKRASSGEKQAVASVITLYGFAAGVREGFPAVSLGWDEVQRLEIYDHDTSLFLEGPRGDLLRIHLSDGTSLVESATKENP